MPLNQPANQAQNRISRRSFLFYSAVAAGTAAAGGCVSPRPRPRLISPNEKLNIAMVGYGGQGAADADCCSGDNIVALCDADEKIGGDLRARFPKAKYYQDFRKMLETDKSIDAFNIATPDHLHAAMAALAMKAGKHVYVQKPLTHSVYEARLLRNLARGCKVATQMGNQGSAENGLRRAVEVIQSGIIGNVTEVYVWSNRPIWPQGIPRPVGQDPVPEGLDWDLWLGPAPWRPYKGKINPDGPQPSNPNYYHTFNWRGWMDFGTGSLGDMACHTANLPFRALKLGYPTEVEAETVDLTKDCYPIKSKIRFQFPAREGLAPVTFRWYDGGNRTAIQTRRPYHDGNNKPPPEVMADVVAKMDKAPDSGCLMVGDKGQIFSPDDYGTKFFLKLKDDKEFLNSPDHPALPSIPQTIPRNRFMNEDNPRHSNNLAHHREWIQACKGGPLPYSNFDIAAYLTEIILLGCVAIRAGKTLQWDGPNMRAKNAPEARPFVHPAFRKGWGL
ncbi:MAG: Gfo/Idh/MocA family oxidoreductase [Verrucomicrobiota bacterium]|jgi:predicted dehydrogenase